MAVPGDSWCFSLLDTTEPQGQCTQWTFLCHLIIFGRFCKSLCEKCPVQCHIDLPKAALDKLAVNEARFQFQWCFGSLNPSVLHWCDVCRDGRSFLQIHMFLFIPFYILTDFLYDILFKKIYTHSASEHSWSTNASLSAQYCALTRRPCSRLFWLSIRVYCDEWTNKAAKYPAGLVRGSSRTVFRSQPSQPAILTLDRSPVKAGGVVSDTCLWCSLSIS